MSLRLLVIDDDSKQRKITIDAVEMHAKTYNKKIIAEQAGNYDEGISKLNSGDFDAAIIDLRLKQNAEEAEGNKILQLIKQKLRFPVRIVTGHLGDLEEEFTTNSYFISSSSRDRVDYTKILSDFIEIHESGITNILNNKGRINADLSKIFWTHICDILPSLIEEKKKGGEIDFEKILLRYISSHILEYLELTGENNLEPAHPVEFYIKPRIKPNVFTGDVVIKNEDNTAWVVLTPACDLAIDSKRPTPKAEYITLCKILPIDVVEGGKNLGDTKKLKSNNFDLKFHYLPKSPLFDGGYVNFQYIESTPIGDLPNKFSNRLAVASPFKKDMISRFSNYYSRQGQPVISH